MVLKIFNSQYPMFNKRVFVVIQTYFGSTTRKILRVAKSNFSTLSNSGFEWSGSIVLSSPILFKMGRITFEKVSFDWSEIYIIVSTCVIWRAFSFIKEVFPISHNAVFALNA